MWLILVASALVSGLADRGPRQAAGGASSLPTDVCRRLPDSRCSGVGAAGARGRELLWFAKRWCRPPSGGGTPFRVGFPQRHSEVASWNQAGELASFLELTARPSVLDQAVVPEH